MAEGVGGSEEAIIEEVSKPRGRTLKCHAKGDEFASEFAYASEVSRGELKGRSQQLARRLHVLRKPFHLTCQNCQETLHRKSR